MLILENREERNILEILQNIKKKQQEALQKLKKKMEELDHLIQLHKENLSQEKETEVKFFFNCFLKLIFIFYFRKHTHNLKYNFIFLNIKFLIVF